MVGWLYLFNQNYRSYPAVSAIFGLISRHTHTACRGCVKSISPPAAAKHSLDGDIFFLILRSKIRKKMSPLSTHLIDRRLSDKKVV